MLIAGALTFRLVPLTARFEAFIRAILSAPVRLGPKPMDVASAGTRISDANASPVPTIKEPGSAGFLGDAVKV